MKLKYITSVFGKITLTIHSFMLVLSIVACHSDNESDSSPIDVIPPTFEPPFNGAWVSDTGQSIEIVAQVDNDIVNGLSEFPITAFISNPQTDCIGIGDITEMEYAGFMSANTLSLSSSTTAIKPCLKGTFTDLVTLELEDLASGTVSNFTNNRVEVDLGDGIWESADNGGLSLYMNQPRSIDNDSISTITGCIIMAGETANSFNGPMTGFATLTRQRPFAELLKADADDAVLFKKLEFIDKQNLEVQDVDGLTYRLTRSIVDTIDISCP